MQMFFESKYLFKIIMNLSIFTLRKDNIHFFFKLLKLEMSEKRSLKNRDPTAWMSFFPRNMIAYFDIMILDEHQMNKLFHQVQNRFLDQREKSKK